MNRLLLIQFFGSCMLLTPLASAETSAAATSDRQKSPPPDTNTESSLVRTKLGKSYKFRSVSRIDIEKNLVAIVHDGGISSLKIDDITDDTIGLIESSEIYKQAKAQQDEALRARAMEKSAKQAELDSQRDQIIEHGKRYRQTIAERKRNSEKKDQLIMLARKIKSGEATFSDWTESLGGCSIELFTELVGKPDASMKSEVELGMDGPKVKFDAEKYVYRGSVLDPLPKFSSVTRCGFDRLTGRFQASRAVA